MNRKTCIFLQSFIILMGLVTILMPWFELATLYNIITVTLFIIATIEFASYKLNYDAYDGDKEYYFSSIASLLVCSICVYIGQLATKNNIAILVAGWVGLIALSKLIKIDYLHDKQDKRLNVYLFTSGLFFICGLVLSLTLFFGELTAIISIGYLIVIYGATSLAEEYSNVLLKKSRKKND